MMYSNVNSSPFVWFSLTNTNWTRSSFYSVIFDRSHQGLISFLISTAIMRPRNKIRISR
jgi:hypothetical protein